MKQIERMQQSMKKLEYADSFLKSGIRRRGHITAIITKL